ncbi:MAG: hypothetical protein WD844_08055 [Thermoleophilaceae bacterium]
MSRQQRFGLVALAVAVAVAAFVIASPGDDDDDPADTGAATVPAQTETAPAETAPAETETEPAEPPEPEATRIRVEGGQPVGGLEEITVNTGDTVRLTVTSDGPQQVHVHGYDIIEDAAPDAPARFEFDADIEGVFEVELEGPHTQIAELRVEP